MTQRRRVTTRLLAAVTMVLCGTLLSSTSGTASADPGPAGIEIPPAFTSLVTTISSMGSAPAGANDWACRPSPQHPRPVVLVHGTGMSMTQTWTTVSAALRDAGYCVYALNYGAAAQSWGSGDIRRSADELASFIDAVRAHSGSAQVDVVGHSQGGTMTRQYLRFDGGADPADPSRNKVHSLVMLGPTTHGTTFNGLQGLVDPFTALRLTDDATNERLAEFTFGLASYQQFVGSKFLEQLNAGHETMPGVDYTVIASMADQIVTPPAGSFLVPDPGSSVRNIWMHDVCPGAQLSHLDLLNDPRAVFLVQAALDPSYGRLTSAPC